MSRNTVFNEFVLKFGTVNGSGSASANFLCAKVLFRMGLPVSAKNIFPRTSRACPPGTRSASPRPATWPAAPAST
ncbi:hypothetical protein ACFSZS_03055 [Seohaeicola zhoushanensis]